MDFEKIDSETELNFGLSSDPDEILEEFFSDPDLRQSLEASHANASSDLENALSQAERKFFEHLGDHSKRQVQTDELHRKKRISLYEIVF